MFQTPNWLDREDTVLASYAMRTRNSRGRRHDEPDHPYRTLYQRDRDRIIHSTAFRRLMYKTQVLVYQTSDHHRTRLTHTLEVAQISRTIARQLGLNEDLTEAIALAHDLGHPPFGHAGEYALDQCMRDLGGFEHNRHGLRIMEELEHRYADFPGLNLTWEVREAQAMHSKQRDAEEVSQYLDTRQPTLEAQVVDAADSLAYDTHDLDDALSIGLITQDEIIEIPFCRQASDEIASEHGKLSLTYWQPSLVRTLIDWQVRDLLEQTREELTRQKIETVDDIRSAPDILVKPGPEVRRLKDELEEFLRKRVYQHHRVMRMTEKGKRMLERMFHEFCRVPEQLPQRYFARIQPGQIKEAVCDYLAGMTDRFAQDEYLRLFQPYALV